MTGKGCPSPLERESDIRNVRKFVGLPQIVLKSRDCLRCSKRFTGEGSHNRLCDACRSRGAWIVI